MRIGVLARGDEVAWAHRLGFKSIEWIRFDEGSCSIEHADWKPFAERLAAEAKSLNIRISAIGALYRNPLDPRQSKFARATFQRAIEVASHIGVKTVSGFAGVVIETEIHQRGGHAERGKCRCHDLTGQDFTKCGDVVRGARRQLAHG